MAEAGKDVVDDARTSLDFSKQVFDPLEDFQPPKADAEGQLSLDLADAPRAAPVEGAQGTPNRIFLTPEKAEKIRMQGQLAAGAKKSEKQGMFSFRSLTTVTDFEDVLDDIAGTKAVLANEFTKIKGGDVQRWTTVKAQAAAKLRQMAQMTGEDLEAVVKRLMSADLGDPTKLAAEVHARRLPGPSRTDLSQVPYSETQSLYDRWVELTGTVKISGKTLREKLEETFESRSYKTAPDGFIGASSGTKGAIVRKVIQSYREKAKSELPELRELIVAERRGAANILREQRRFNRNLFPLADQPERRVKRRTFEDLLD